MAEPGAAPSRDWAGRATPFRRPTVSTVFAKALMAISGAGLSLFLLLHILGNSSAFLGRTAFTAYARHLHALGPLILALECCLLLLAGVHVATGVWLFRRNLKSRPVPYQVKIHRQATLSSRLMPVSGLVILVFLMAHVSTFRRPAGPSPDLVRLVLSRPGLAAFYLFALAALVSHLSHGLWSLGQSLGMSLPRHDLLLRRAAVIVSVIVGMAFMALPLAALFWTGFLR